MPPVLLLPTGMLVAVSVWAAQTDPLAIILNYGILGVFFVLAITGRIYLKPHVDDLNKRIDSLEAIIKEFQTASRNTVPALSRATDVLEALPTQDGISVAEMRTLISRLEELAGGPQGKRR